MGVVQGGGGAIGGEIARLFARAGAKVFLASRNHKKMDIVAKAITEAGGIHIAVNGIGMAHNQFKSVTELTLEEFMLPVQGYIQSSFLIAKVVSQEMKKQRSGVILHITTPASRMAGPGFIGHSVACAGVEAISRNLSGDLAREGVRSVCIRSHLIPEAIASGSHSKNIFEETAAKAGITLDQWLEGAVEGTLLKKLPTLGDIAETALFLASDRAGAITGTIMNVSGGVLLD